MQKLKIIIAKYLGINPSQIIKIEECKNIFFVVISDISTRFISKLIVYKNGDKVIFKRFVTNKVQDWNLFDLKFLSLKQLQSLCILLGCAVSGTKSKLINRLKDIVKVRIIVSPFFKMINIKPSDNSRESYNITSLVATFFAASYKSQELRSFCKLVNVFAPSNKYGMAMSLLNWLRNSINKGMRAYEESVKSIRDAKAQQIKLT